MASEGGTGAMIPAGWRERLEAMKAAWSVIAPTRIGPSGAESRSAFTRVRTDYLRLIDQGRWVSGATRPHVGPRGHR